MHELPLVAIVRTRVTNWVVENQKSKRSENKSNNQLTNVATTQQNKMKKIYSIILFALIAINSNAQTAGSLDTTFNHTGIVTTTFGTHDLAFGIAIQSDGKIVAAGSTDANPNQSFALSRYNTNGTLDTTFGTGGKTTTDLGSSFFGSRAEAVFVQPDGKIVATGHSAGGTGEYTLVRYNSNGTLDNAFGTAGIVTIPFNYQAYASALQPDGKIIAAGTGSGSFAVVRYNTNGTLDNAFGTSGVATTIIGSNATVYGVALQVDGKIIAAGGTSTAFAIARYKTDGVIDSTFGVNGIVTTTIGTSSAAYSVLLQLDGKIVAGGASSSGSATIFALARYTTTGTLDASFGTGGFVTTTVGSSSSYALGISLQADGKIVASGYAGNAVALARYDANGALDNIFGTGGIVTTSIGSGSISSRANAVALQTDEKIVVAGYTGISTGTEHFLIVRYNSINTTGIADISDNIGISIYPNPADDLINISSRNIIKEIVVTDLMGKEIYSKEILSREPAIDIRQFPSGIYLLQVKTEKNTFNKTIIIQ